MNINNWVCVCLFVCLFACLLVVAVVTRFAGDGVPACIDGQGTSAFLDTPMGIDINSFGTVFITEGSTVVRKITPTGWFVSWLASLLAYWFDVVGWLVGCYISVF